MKNPPKAKPLRTNPFGGMSDPPSSNIDPNYPRPQDYPHMSDQIASPDPMDVDRRPLREDVGSRNMGNVGVTGGRGIGGHKIASFPFQYLGASREGGEVGNPQELINTYKPFVGVGLNVTKQYIYIYIYIYYRVVAKSGIGKLISFDILKTYFDINNEYVLKKLKIILLPVLHVMGNILYCRRTGSEWRILIHKEERSLISLEGILYIYIYIYNRYDVNAPDLYIPIMGLITFMLILAFSSGLYTTFSTELLGLTFTTCITFWIIEGLFMFACTLILIYLYTLK